MTGCGVEQGAFDRAPHRTAEVPKLHMQIALFDHGG